MSQTDGGVQSDESDFMRASYLNVGANLVKIAVEGSVGLFFGSMALVADAAHSVADLAASLVVLVWGRLSFVEPDESHPHGHERVEPLTALFVGGVIVVLGGLLLYDNVHKILGGVDSSFSPLLVAGLVFSVADMGFAFWYTRRIAERIGSPSLDALAKDCLNDIYTSGVALIGVAGIWAGFPVLDPVVGGIVSIFVVRQGVEISRENIDYLAGRAPPEEEQERIGETVRSHPEVRGIHDFTAHYVGSKIEVETHVEIDADHSLREAHDIESEIYRSLKEIDSVGDVHIHLDPAGIGEWKEASTEDGSYTDTDTDTEDRERYRKRD
ncbi:MAG: cation diffusion facilitator family transporter [Halobacteria archaeon]|nr:cation diffusion facilitator family transporter [Halobacteria archaeon]